MRFEGVHGSDKNSVTEVHVCTSTLLKPFSSWCCIYINMTYARQVQNIHWLLQLHAYACNCILKTYAFCFAVSYSDIHRSSELNDFLLTGNENGNLYIHKCNEYTNKEKRDIAAVTTNLM